MNEPKQTDTGQELPADAGWLAGDLREWANRTVSAPPVDLDGLRRQIDAERVIAVAPKRAWGPPRLAWNLAAAALFLFALTQVSFSVRRGETEWSWGRPPATGDATTRLVNLQASVESLAYSLNQHQVWLAALAETDTQMKAANEQTQSQLAAWQKLESETRYADDEKLIALILAQAGVQDRSHQIMSNETY